jgi:hypothetical protein
MLWKTTITCHVWDCNTDSRIYSELAEQYKLLDAASAVAKRHVLAEHLKEVIDTLEQKVSKYIIGLVDHRRRQNKTSRR